MKKKIIPLLIGILAIALSAFSLCGAGINRGETTGEHEESVVLPEEKSKDASGSEADSEEAETLEKTAETEALAERKTMAESELSMTKENSQAEVILSGMTKEQKVAQLFIVPPEVLCGIMEVEGAKGADSDAGKGSQAIVTTVDETLLRGMQKYPVGGMLFFKKNLKTPEQTKSLLTGIQSQLTEETGIPVFLCVDEEGGRVERIAGNDAFGVAKVPAMGKLAKEGDLQQITSAAETIGGYLSDLGFNVDFAPDADVITNKKNTAIGDRSFGTDPQQVADMAWAYACGLHAKGMLATYKHFPGHGGTEGDTHKGYAYSNKTIDELKNAELIPFADGAQKGVDFIMTAHISLPGACTEDVPASLCKELLTGVLREEFGYQGLIVTDALNMGAITRDYSSGEAARKAFAAGADLLLMPVNFKEAYEAILSDVQTGRISEERLDESVLRIITAKRKIMSEWIK